MVDQSLRGFLEMVEKNHPEELVRIKEPVGREDITATVFEFERAGRYPVIIFERVEGFEGSVVTNIAANRDSWRRVSTWSRAICRRRTRTAARITGPWRWWRTLPGAKSYWKKTRWT